ncbi:MAG: tryptophan synthase subunit alpha [Archaeoglobaceae archaeon]
MIGDVFHNGKALVTFITAGDPHPKATVKFLHALEENADILELGIPFSDPMADGPTIQKANYRALNNGMRLNKVFEVVEQFKDNSDTPVVLMTYYNPIYVSGEENFVRTASKAGVDGLIVVDLPIEESRGYIQVCRDHNMDTVFLAAPNTPQQRLMSVNDASSGFVYLVSLYGTTGVREDVPQESIDFLQRAREICSKPLCVGFGISRKEQVEKLVKNGADGVVVGSSLVNIIEKYGDSEDTIKKLEEKTAELRKGL